MARSEARFPNDEPILGLGDSFNIVFWDYWVPPRVDAGQFAATESLWYGDVMKQIRLGLRGSQRKTMERIDTSFCAR